MTQSPDDVAALIERNQGLVRSLALGIHRKGPPHIELDDLIAYGQVGLAEAARDFDPARGNQFSTYAYYRIRGAIYDGLSTMSWFGRSGARHLRYEQRCDEILDESQCEAPAEQQAPSLDDDLRWLQSVSQTMAVVYLATEMDEDAIGWREAYLPDPSQVSAATVLHQREITQRLHSLIGTLPHQEAALIRATYFDGLTLQQAAQRVGLSKSWASRLHAKVIEKLGRALRLQGLVW